MVTTLPKARDTKTVSITFIFSVIYWNIRGVRTKNALPRNKKPIKYYKVDFVALSEPILSMNNIHMHMRYLGYQHCIANSNGQIWLLWTGSIRLL